MTSLSDPFGPAGGCGPGAALTARCPDDVIAAAAVVLGFTPTDSVVMLTFGAEHAFHARLDLPASEADLADLDDALLGPASRHRAQRVVLLLYADDALRAHAAWRVLRAGARRRGLEVVEALRVTATHWHPYLGGDARGRSDGVPYDVSAHPFLVRAVVDGRVLHRSRDQLAATLDPEPRRVAAVEAALAGRPPLGHDGRVASASLLADGAWVQELVRRHVATGSVPGVGDVARLLQAIRVLRLRDAAWAEISRVAAPAHVAFWSDVVRRCPDRLVAPAATMLAWSAWQSGDGALAWCGIDRCLAVDPDYSLAHLLGQALGSALPPSQWQGGFDWTTGLDAAPGPDGGGPLG